MLPLRLLIPQTVDGQQNLTYIPGSSLLWLNPSVFTSIGRFTPSTGEGYGRSPIRRLFLSP
ncbi:MAG: hypothetical protein AAF327_17135 [Cyanobacteria bacterium P01_A01_bin.37]